ncbi:Transcription factor BTF3 [Plecturocebus cupreus]
MDRNNQYQPFQKHTKSSDRIQEPYLEDAQPALCEGPYGKELIEVSSQQPCHGETKQLTEVLPSILNQLGADSLTSFRRLAEALPKPSVDGKAPLVTGEEEEDDEVPDLVENFDEASKNEAN